MNPSSDNDLPVMSTISPLVKHSTILYHNLDIVNTILQFLDNKTLTICLRVSQPFLDIAGSLLYHTVLLDTAKTFGQLFLGADIHPSDSSASCQNSTFVRQEPNLNCGERSRSPVAEGKFASRYTPPARPPKPFKNILLAKVRILDISHESEIECDLYREHGKLFPNLDILRITTHCQNNDGCPLIKFLNPSTVIMQNCEVTRILDHSLTQNLLTYTVHDRVYLMAKDGPGCPIPLDWKPSKLHTFLLLRQSWLGFKYLVPSPDLDLTDETQQILIPVSVLNLIPQLSNFVLYFQPWDPTFLSDHTLLEDRVLLANLPIIPKEEVKLKVRIYGVENTMFAVDDKDKIDMSQEVRSGLAELFKSRSSSVQLDNVGFFPVNEYEARESIASLVLGQKPFMDLRKNYKDSLDGLWICQDILPETRQLEKEELPQHSALEKSLLFFKTLDSSYDPSGDWDFWEKMAEKSAEREDRRSKEKPRISETDLVRDLKLSFLQNLRISRVALTALLALKAFRTQLLMTLVRQEQVRVLQE